MRKDEGCHIIFGRGKHIESEIWLEAEANVRGEYNYFGRGILASDIIHLRLERIGDEFSAYCSGDGVDWLTCGQIVSPAEHPIQVGICALGGIGLRGRYRDTATQFGCFRVLRRES